MNTFHEEKNNLICKLEERLDTISCQKLEWELDERIKENHAKIIFDMEKVEYVSSTFLRICIKLVKLTGKERFSLINVSPSVLQVFNIANIGEICSTA